MCHLSQKKKQCAPINCPWAVKRTESSSTYAQLPSLCASLIRQLLCKKLVQIFFSPYHHLLCDHFNLHRWRGAHKSGMECECLSMQLLQLQWLYFVDYWEKNVLFQPDSQSQLFFKKKLVPASNCDNTIFYFTCWVFFVLRTERNFLECRDNDVICNTFATVSFTCITIIIEYYDLVKSGKNWVVCPINVQSFLLKYSKTVHHCLPYSAWGWVCHNVY